MQVVIIALIEWGGVQEEDVYCSRWSLIMLYVNLSFWLSLISSLSHLYFSPWTERSVFKGVETFWNIWNIRPVVADLYFSKLKYQYIPFLFITGLPNILVGGNTHCPVFVICALCSFQVQLNFALQYHCWLTQTHTYEPVNLSWNN